MQTDYATMQAGQPEQQNQSGTNNILDAIDAGVAAVRVVDRLSDAEQGRAVGGGAVEAVLETGIEGTVEAASEGAGSIVGAIFGFIGGLLSPF